MSLVIINPQEFRKHSSYYPVSRDRQDTIPFPTGALVYILCILSCRMESQQHHLPTRTSLKTVPRDDEGSRGKFSKGIAYRRSGSELLGDAPDMQTFRCLACSTPCLKLGVTPLGRSHFLVIAAPASSRLANDPTPRREGEANANGMLISAAAGLNSKLIRSFGDI